MKLAALFEASSKLGPMEHAFWQNTKGPNNESGASLHYIQDEKAWNDLMMVDAKADNDERRIKRIEQALKNPQKYSHPSFDWWISKEAFEKGDTGFGGMTKQKVMKENPKLKIHNSKEEAVRAAGY